MSFWAELRVPAQYEALVAVYDSHWLTQHAEKSGSLDEVIAVMSGYFAVTSQIINDGGGKFIKTLGDSGLAVFPLERIDEGILALHRVRQAGEEWLAGRGYDSRVAVKWDVGPVVFGMVGSPGEERLEVFGRPVATAFTLPSNGFAMTAAVFRHLRPETRKLFKKHTPPIRYIGIDDRRLRDSLAHE